MKSIIYITVFLLTFNSITFSQSVINADSGTSITNEAGADICADQVLINGTYSGGGTICGTAAYVLNLTVLIEGFYNSSTDIMVSDTVRVYLRNISSPHNIVDSSDALLSASGTGTFIFSNVINGTNYYIDIRHRNSIQTWSATGQSFNSFFLPWDFTFASTQAYGNNMIQVNTSPVKFAIYGGDINQNGIVDGADLALVDNDVYNFVTGYVNTDVTGDNVVDASDLAIVDNNVYNFVSVQRPF